MNRSQLKIVRIMQKAGDPLILNHIAKKSKMAPQLVDYNLEKMIENGLVLLVVHEDRKYYMLQPIFYDENWLNALLHQLTPFIEDMSGGDMIDFTQCKESSEKVVIEILSTFLRRFEEEVPKMFK